MRTRLLVILSIIVLGAYYANSNEDVVLAPEIGEPTSDVSGDKTSNKDDSPIKDESYNVLKDPELNSQFGFNKEIHFIHISEVNDSALNEKPIGGIESQDVYYDKNENVLHFLHDSEFPTKETELIIVQDKYNHDYLLDYDLHFTEGHSVNLNIDPIDNEYVNNNNRLFLNEEIELKASDGKASISIDGEIHEVGIGKTIEIPKEGKDVSSKLVITNYGLLNTLNSMSYQDVGEASDKD